MVVEPASPQKGKPNPTQPELRCFVAVMEEEEVGFCETEEADFGNGEKVSGVWCVVCSLR